MPGIRTTNLEVWIDKVYELRTADGYGYRLEEIDEGVWQLSYCQRNEKIEKITFTERDMPLLQLMLGDATTKLGPQ